MAESFSEEDFPLKTGQLYEKFGEDTGYSGSEAAFSEMLGKLKKRGLLDNPQYGKYRPSEEGWGRASKLESGGEQKPSGYDALVGVLEKLLDSFEDKSVLLSFSKIHEFNNDAFDDFRNNPDIFLDALSDARDRTGKNYVRLRNDIGGFGSGWSSIRNDGAEGDLIQLEGIVEDISERFTLRTEVVFECSSCGRQFEKKSLMNEVSPPESCQCGSTSFDEKSFERRDAKEFIIKGENSVKALVYGDVLPENLIEDIKLGNHLSVTGILKFTGGRVSRPFLDVVSLRQTARVEKENYDSKDRQKVRQKVKLVSQNQNPFEIFADSLAPDVKGRKDAKRTVAASLIGSPQKKLSSLLVDSRKGSEVLLKEVSRVFPDAVHASGTLKPETHYEDVKWVRNGELLESRNGVLCVQNLDKLEEKDYRMLSSVLATGSFKAGQEDYSVDNNIVAATRAVPKDDLFDLVCRVEGSGLDQVTQDFTQDQEYMLEEELEIYRAVTRKVDPVIGDDAKDYLESSREWEQEDWETVLALTSVYARARLAQEADIGDAEDALALFESLKAH